MFKRRDYLRVDIQYYTIPKDKFYCRFIHKSRIPEWDKLNSMTDTQKADLVRRHHPETEHSYSIIGVYKCYKYDVVNYWENNFIT